MASKIVLYSAVGDQLTHYDVDVDSLTLTKRKTIKVPAVVQYAWPHPDRRTIYVTTSNRGKGMKADRNHVSALRIAANGELSHLGDPVPLWTRAVHLCMSADAQYLLNAHNLPHAGITVHRLDKDGSIGAEVKQPAGLEFGIYPHQVLVSLKTGTVMLIDRGNDAKKDKPEDPGALRLFRIDTNGVLSNLQVVAPNGGYGFGPRHIDFHPAQPWVYASMERQDELLMYRMQGEKIETEAAYKRTTLARPVEVKKRQLAGPIHVHPDGRTVYVANRNDRTVEFNGQQVWAGGDNTFAVYAIDQKTGEPTNIQNADTHTIHVRTFAIDPSGRMMVAGSIDDINVRDGDKVVKTPATLSVMKVGADGKLEFVRKYDVETNGRIHYWMGMFALA